MKEVKENKTDEQYFNEVLKDIEGMSEKRLINYIAELYQQIDDLKKNDQVKQNNGFRIGG